MDLTYTRALLALWGRFARPDRLGYPSHAAFVPVARGETRVPPEVGLVDAHITAMRRDPDDSAHAHFLVSHYSTHDTVRDRIKAARLSSRTYYRRLDGAQWALHVRLDA